MESVLVFSRRHTTFVFGIAIVAALSGILLVSRVSFDANILRLLPQRSPTVRDFQLFLRDFGSLDHLYVVFNSAGAIGDHGELVDRDVEALRHAPEIQSVDAQLFETRQGLLPLRPGALICSAPTGRRRRCPALKEYYN